MADNFTDPRLADLLLCDHLGILQCVSLTVLKVAFELCEILQFIQHF